MKEIKAKGEGEERTYKHAFRNKAREEEGVNGEFELLMIIWLVTDLIYASMHIVFAL